MGPVQQEGPGQQYPQHHNQGGREEQHHDGRRRPITGGLDVGIPAALGDVTNKSRSAGSNANYGGRSNAQGGGGGFSFCNSSDLVSPEKLRSQIESLENENEELKSLLHSLQSGAMRHPEIGHKNSHLDQVLRTNSSIESSTEVRPGIDALRYSNDGIFLDKEEDAPPQLPHQHFRQPGRRSPTSPHAPPALDNRFVGPYDDENNGENLDPNQPILIGFGKEHAYKRA